MSSRCNENSAGQRCAQCVIAGSTAFERPSQKCINSRELRWKIALGANREPQVYRTRSGFGFASKVPLSAISTVARLCLPVSLGSYPRKSVMRLLKFPVTHLKQERSTLMVLKEVRQEL